MAAAAMAAAAMAAAVAAAAAERRRSENACFVTISENESKIDSLFSLLAFSLQPHERTVLVR